MKLPTSLRQAVRVVVTGVGAVTPLGVGAGRSWERLLACHSGIGKLTGEEFEKMPAKVAALVPRGKEEHQFDEKRFTDAEWRQMSKATAFAVVAAEEALADAQWKPNTDKELHNTGVSIGTGMIDLSDVIKTGTRLAEQGPKIVSPYFIPRILPNMIAGHLAIRYGIKGPNHCVSTACTTGLHSIGDAFMMIQRGLANVMICGSAESSINGLCVAGFCRIRALCTKFNSDPQQASRPFDSERDGFVMGEGAGVLILEELQHALERNARIYAEVLGYGLSGDGYHLTSPCPDGAGAKLSMRRALTDAGVKPEEVGYVNAHATSTKQGDSAETTAIYEIANEGGKRADKEQPLVSSCKGAIGHLLGAAGSVETIVTALSCYHGVVPPNRNLKKVDVPMNMNFSHSEKATPFPTSSFTSRRVAMKNSFGFWGANATLCLASMDQ
ncbi:3 oxoacyl (acyl carrier protein) synthase [Trichuris trichiura]|uniref:3-oxoacyl-[acyl-carrier-protein] synthase n=1 Tax=Trichuris trichiura TaxID=36087 RepID=A0A077YWM3_TRITR|nr:3 oxoacyl (acyl carrier protein) synthase [Trichuris trichiura]